MTALQWKERSEWGLWEKFPKAPFAPCGYCVETQKCHYWQWSQLPEYLPDFRATELRDCSYLCAHFLDEETGTVRLSFSNVKQLVKAELGFAHRLRWVLIAVFYFHSSLSPKPGTKSWCSFSHNIIKEWEREGLLYYPKVSPSRAFVSMPKSLDSVARGVSFTKRSTFLPGHTVMVFIKLEMEVASWKWIPANQQVNKKSVCWLWHLILIPRENWVSIIEWA